MRMLNKQARKAIANSDTATQLERGITPDDAQLNLRNKKLSNIQVSSVG